MKPFDLEKALAGEPVITRAGNPVKIAGYDEMQAPDEAILGWIDDYGSCQWHANGKYFSTKESTKDLFMAPKERKEWLVRFQEKKGEDILITLFNEKPDFEKLKEVNKAFNLTLHEITITQ